MSDRVISVDWKRITANFVSAGVTWFAMSAASFALADLLPEATSVAVSAIVVGIVFLLLSAKIHFFKKRIVAAISGVGLSSAISKLPTELGVSTLDGPILILSVIGVIGCIGALIYFIYAD
ncbi:MAG: hypothetical protein ACR2FJ_04260 [Qipengyuania sp.]